VLLWVARDGNQHLRRWQQPVGDMYNLLHITLQVQLNPCERTAYKLLGDVTVFMSALKDVQELPWPVLRCTLRLLLLLLPQHFTDEAAGQQPSANGPRSLAVVLVRQAQYQHQNLQSQCVL
jgi:hypothetical protein